jgi:hypothetical protein
MITAKTLRVALAVAVLMIALGATPALAAGPAPAAALSISSVAMPTHFNPKEAGKNSYEVRVDNVGGAATDGTPIKITDTLPEGLSVESVEFRLRFKHVSKNVDFASSICNTVKPAEVATVTCTVPHELPTSGEESALLAPAEELRLVIFVTFPGSATEGRTLTNHATVEGGGTPVVATTAQNEISAKQAPPGFAEYTAAATGPDGQTVSQAGSHPYQFTTSFSFNTRRKSPGAAEPAEFVPSGGDPKDTPVVLPPGLIGNPTATSRCTLQQFNTTKLLAPFPESPAIQLHPNECPDSSVVGYITLRRVEEAGTAAFPIYNLVPPPGMPAQLGFSVLELPVFIDTEVRPEENYKVVGVVRNISEAKRVIAASVTLWGTPAASIHDPIRGRCLNSAVEYPNSLAPYIGGPCPAGITPKPFLRLPTSCEGPFDFTMSLDTWGDPGNFVSATSGSPEPVGCDALDFEPTLEARPTTAVADSPGGLRVDLRIPQNEDPEALGEADARNVAVTFPKGMAVNPSGANGLEACSPEQVGLKGSSPIRFDNDPAQCPDGSKIGSVEVDTPLLEEPLHGGIYVATPHENPFDSLLAVYIAVNDPETGIVVKLAGHVEPDPQTGQLTTVFDENPQVPFNEFTIDLFSGALAPLRTPAVCGTYRTTSVMTPWSAPESGPAATPLDTYAISQSPSGSICPTSEGALPNAPAFDAGTIAPIAGAYSPFVVHLHREDGSQEFSSLTVTPPPGLVGKLAGIPYCPDAALAAAAAKSGKAEKANPSCPAASEVGGVEVAAGAGPAPYYAQGHAYLTGPYKGAPLSLAIVTPAAAGPYDLGTVVVRTALYVDPETAQITAVSDPIPHILQGIPLDVRSVAVKMDRPEFTLNPTSCDPMAVGGREVSTLGQAASLSDRFQVGKCAALGFKQNLSLRLKGGTSRNDHPALTATLTYPKGAYANVAAASVALPHSEFLENAHIETICTRVQFAASQCPAASIYGHARAISPLLDQPLEGPVYLRSSSNALPDLVADLNGQIHIVLDGRIDSIHGGIRTTFEGVPDAPVSKFVLKMAGGKKGLLVNSRDICKHTNRATAKFDGQNGKVDDFKVALKAQCGKKAKHKKHKASRRRGG